MSEILHVWALAPAAIGTCCLAADRRRVRVPEIAASLLMLLAMIDVSRVAPLLAPVYWAALLIAAGMLLAAMRCHRRTDRPHDSDARPVMAGVAMALHTSIGLVMMAALMLTMGRMDAAAIPHSHGMTASSLVFVLLLAAAAYAAASGVAATRSPGRLDRVQYIAMGASTSVMALALVG